MKKIVILTATRAEYGLLKPLIIKFNDDINIDMRLVVTGAHLVPEFGMTVQEIEEAQIPIDKRIQILLNSDTPNAISKSMGLAMISFAEYFEECKPDALLVLGDRYETLAVCCVAMSMRIPIFHLYGGETTEGAMDEAIRHSITKMSYLHFTSTERYRHRVIQMGEAPGRVFTVGALGIENVIQTKLLSLTELEKKIGVNLERNYAVGTFHPVTLENATAEEQVEELLAALEKNQNIFYLFTKANADSGGYIINKRFKEYSSKHENFILIDSLGMKGYLSALKYASFVIGNSSSGLIEAPSFGIPTINIGDRQKGRIVGNSVIQCHAKVDAIDKAIKKAGSEEWRTRAKKARNPYGDGNTSDQIVAVVEDFLIHDKIDLKKKFYDLVF